MLSRSFYWKTLALQAFPLKLRDILFFGISPTGATAGIMLRKSASLARWKMRSICLTARPSTKSRRSLMIGLTITITTVISGSWQNSRQTSFTATLFLAFILCWANHHSMQSLTLFDFAWLFYLYFILSLTLGTLYAKPAVFNSFRCYRYNRLNP